MVNKKKKDLLIFFEQNKKKTYFRGEVFIHSKYIYIYFDFCSPMRAAYASGGELPWFFFKIIYPSPLLGARFVCTQVIFVSSAYRFFHQQLRSIK